MRKLKLKKPKIKVKQVKTRATKEPKKERLAPLVRILGLEHLKPPKGARRKKKLLGRGPGSGHGKTSTRGHKGQASRAGRDFYLGFEGGQTPLIRKLPKRGFSNIKFKREYQVVNVKDLARIKEPMIDPAILARHGLIKNKDRLTKILGEGQLSQALIVKAHAFSRKAKELIEKTGGKAEVLNA